ncbi:glycoside hydrolase family 16 protein [Allorhodopirellula solitaria]|uniref:Glucan endo-1,3-beta-glucosidase A1 n=1 Tax=Allorhodopirellula solitaria TaxID=2527987 RepID=A0A5C5XPS8_9BACT|nr:glycoside hydrolase family 16 protein [Allorhodopirellula solitaria]TWT64579.1 Glucan endo-1,3-beta-glucosidase A1 precursor [Allorhodopirellula solitaria]
MKKLSKLATRLTERLPIILRTALGTLIMGQALAPAQDTTPQAELVWSDEFDGDSLDYSKWGVAVNAFGGGNHELQIYTDRPENVRVENGNLVLEARHDHAAIAGTEREYSSGRIHTKHRGDWTYGRVEVRAKLPVGQGIWPAIWMLPTDDAYGGWAASGEIDIMEYRGQTPNEVLGTLHFGGSWPENTHSSASYKLPAGTFAEEFHVFTLDWQAEKMVWSVDGHAYRTETKWHSSQAEYPAPFDQRFHLLLNLAVGGGFVGSPDATTAFPQQLLVDYVRVYQ